ncbi:MAG: Rpn family recombination-promoting nuclease/putative transposase, partial [Cytophagales bacterium]|nr:Rpn family recombination-promoting nuclease/putative transposase [Cytophagales bacterium]
RDLYFTFIELPKFTKRISELAPGLDYWCYYLKHAPETEPTDYALLVQHSPIIKRAYQALDQHYWSEAELNMYEDLLKAERDRKGIERQKLMDAEARGKEEGIQRGRKEGRKEGILETAKNLIQQGIPLDVISKATGLSKGELAQLS